MKNFLLLATAQGLVVNERDGGEWHTVRRCLTEAYLTSVAARGDLIMVGTTMGIFRSEDLGESWETACVGLTSPHVRWLAFHPEVSDLVLVGTEPAEIFISRDGGGTWQARPQVSKLRHALGWFLPYSPAKGCVRGFTFHGKRAYAAVEVGGVLRSDDGGETWSLVGGSSGKPDDMIGPPRGFIHPDVHDLAAHPASPDLVYAPTGGGLYRSMDGGRCWESIYKGYCRAVWLDPYDPDHLILGPADGVDRNGRIETTRDGGRTWLPASNGLETPWQEHMVERFYQSGEELLAVLSNGDLVVAPLETLIWRQVLSDVKDVKSLVTIGV